MAPTPPPRTTLRDLSPVERATCSELLSIANLLDRIKTVAEAKAVIMARVSEILVNVGKEAPEDSMLWKLDDEQINLGSGELR